MRVLLCPPRRVYASSTIVLNGYSANDWQAAAPIAIAPEGGADEPVVLQVWPAYGTQSPAPLDGVTDLDGVDVDTL